MNSKRKKYDLKNGGENKKKGVPKRGYGDRCQPVPKRGAAQKKKKKKKRMKCGARKRSTCSKKKGVHRLRKKKFEEPSGPCAREDLVTMLCHTSEQKNAPDQLRVSEEKGRRKGLARKGNQNENKGGLNQYPDTGAKEGLLGHKRKERKKKTGGTYIV